MKKTILFLISIILVLSTACSDDQGGSVTDPFGTGGIGGTGNVTFTISSKLDQQGGATFSATPSVAIKLSKITASVAAQQYSESAQYDGATVINANVTEEFAEYPAGSGVASGQQWTFQFEGTLASNNHAYNVTSNYTIP